MLALPLRAILEEVFAGLDPILAPQHMASGLLVVHIVLACEAMPRLQLAEPRGESLVGSSHGWARLLLLAGSLLAVLGPDKPSLGLFAGIRSLCFKELALEVGEGPWGHAFASVVVFVAEPFHAVGVWLVCGLFRLVVWLLVSFDLAVAGVPPYPNCDLRFTAAEISNMFPGYMSPS